MRLWPKWERTPSKHKSDELRDDMLAAAAKLDVFVKALRMEVDKSEHHSMLMKLDETVDGEEGPVTDQDPLHGTDSPRHEQPETVAEGIARLGRDKVSHHATAAEPLLVSADSLTAEIVGLRKDLTEQGELFTEGIARLERDQGGARWGVFVAAAAVLALVLAIILGFFVYDDGRHITDLERQRVASDTERARVDGTHRDAFCTVIAAQRGTYSTAARAANPLGAGAYDDFFKEIAKAAAAFNCDAG